MIRINCFISVKASKKDEVLSAAKRLTEASLKQDGCIAYDIYMSATRPEVLMICETWRDEASLKAHSDSQVFHDEVSIIHNNAEMKLETFEM